MKSKRLSVIIPNFNDGDHLAYSLKAICEQSRPPDELIVVDDGSTDDSLQVLEESRRSFPFIQVICNEENRGIVYSANRGVNKASGDYVYVASANDLVLPGLFEKSMDLLSEHPYAALACSDAVCINVIDNNSVTTSRTGWTQSAGYLSPAALVEIMRKGKGLFHPITNTCIIKRDLLNPKGIWDDRVGCYCDWLLHQVLIMRHGCCFIPEPLAAVRWTGTSMSHRVNTTPKIYCEIMRELLRVLASEQYEDVTDLLIESSSFRAFQLEHFTPGFVFDALKTDLSQRRNARQLLAHLLTEHLLYLLRYIPSSFTQSRSSTRLYWKTVRPGRQWLLDSAKSSGYYVKNLWDRFYARSFHEYDRVRTYVRKQLRD